MNLSQIFQLTSSETRNILLALAPFLSVASNGSAGTGNDVDVRAWRMGMESLIDIGWKLGQAILAVFVVFSLLRWHKGYTEMKNSVVESKSATIEMKEERLKEKEDQLKSKEEQIKEKDEQLRSKDEQLKAKDEQIKAVEKEKDCLAIMSAEVVLKNFDAMKKLLEEQIAQLEEEKRESQSMLEDAQQKLEMWEVLGEHASEKMVHLRDEVDRLHLKLEQRQQEMVRLIESENQILSEPIFGWVKTGDNISPAFSVNASDVIVKQLGKSCVDSSPNIWAEATKKQDNSSGK